jgi:methyltransferase family protein
VAYFRDLVGIKPHPKFWAKTFLHLVTPGGFGYIRRLRARRDPSYVHDRDKHEVRHKHHGGGGWKTERQDGLTKRDYASYEEYVTHQKLKLDEMVKMKGGFSNFDIFDYRLKFYARFRWLSKLLPPDAKILCCGARQGTEVDVLRDLGFFNAWGIDLNPGPANPLVTTGDMMRLDLPNESVDLLYTNCVDHAFDLDGMIAEHARVLKPAGYLLYDIGINTEAGGGPFEAISWDRTEDVILRLLKAFRTIIRIERERQWLWVIVQEKHRA